VDSTGAGRGTVKIHQIYGKDEVFERYFRNDEVNPAYRHALETAGLVLSGFSRNGDVRVAQPSQPHLLIAAFLEASASRVKG